MCAIVVDSVTRMDSFFHETVYPVSLIPKELLSGGSQERLTLLEVTPSTIRCLGGGKTGSGVEEYK